MGLPINRTAKVVSQVSAKTRMDQNNVQEPVPGNRRDLTRLIKVFRGNEMSLRSTLRREPPECLLQDQDGSQAGCCQKDWIIQEDIRGMEEESMNGCKG